MSQKRIATRYLGVFYREIEGCKPIKPIRMYYIRYRIGGCAGRLIEEPVGKSTTISAAQAAQMRAERMTGKAIKKAANLPKDFRPLHGLRHTFASVAVSNGVPLSHVQRLLTHKYPSLTQRYAHLEDEALRQAAENVGNFLDISPENEKIHFIQAVSPEEYRMCTDIWLQASVAGHSFIDKEFWRARQQDMIEKYLPASQVLMAYEDGIPVGFVATVAHELAALFVLPSRWKNGIGRKLLEQLFSRNDQLNLSVYQKNQRAIRFYQHMGFVFSKKQRCALTGEQELVMQWSRVENEPPRNS